MGITAGSLRCSVAGPAGGQAALAGGLLSGVRYQAGCIRTWSGIVLAWVGNRYSRAKVSPEPTK